MTFLKRFSFLVNLQALLVTGVHANNYYHTTDHVQDSLDRVAVESARFVATFNENDANALSNLYVRNGILKLPNAPAVAGRNSIAGAWQGGFDAGLSSLVLSSLYESAGNNRVLENGTY